MNIFNIHICTENLPQLCIQFWFLYTQGWDIELNNNGSTSVFSTNIIVYLAIVSSLLSIMTAVLDIYSAKKLFRVLKKDGSIIGKINVSFYLISNDIKNNSKRLQISTYVLRDIIAASLQQHPRTIEMHFPINIPKGFKIKFTIFSSKLTSQNIQKILNKDCVTDIPKKIKDSWRLTSDVSIQIDTIHVSKSVIIHVGELEGRRITKDEVIITMRQSDNDEQELKKVSSNSDIMNDTQIQRGYL